MGTSLYQGETKFRISFAAVPFALAALKEWAGKAERIMWARPDCLQAAENLDEAFRELCWDATIDADGNITGISFEGEKLGSEDEWMKAIGPHVDAGSYIEHEVEGSHYRWYFDGEKCVSQEGRVVFDDPADKRTAALEAFIRTVESTGGVTRNAKGLYEPGGDPEWIDLGDSYIAACKALGREPKIAATHQIVDFGDGPQDHTLDYPFQGSEAECEAWLEQHAVDRASDGKPRFCLQEIPYDYDADADADAD